MMIDSLQFVCVRVCVFPSIIRLILFLIIIQLFLICMKERTLIQIICMYSCTTLFHFIYDCYVIIYIYIIWAN